MSFIVGMKFTPPHPFQARASSYVYCSTTLITSFGIDVRVTIFPKCTNLLPCSVFEFVLIFVRFVILLTAPVIMV